MSAIASAAAMHQGIGGTASYASTWNPADSNAALSNGNKSAAASGTFGNVRGIAALDPAQEVLVRITGGTAAYLGLANLTGALPASGTSFGGDANAVVYAAGIGGQVFYNNTLIATFGAAAINDIISISVVAGKFTVKKNGVFIGDVAMPVTGTVYPAGSFGSGATVGTII